MITSTKKEKVVAKKVTYPCLMVSTKSGMVLLTTGKGEKGHGYATLSGTVVNSPSASIYGMGCKSTTWEEETFIPYIGEVILESK